MSNTQFHYQQSSTGYEINPQVMPNLKVPHNFYQQGFQPLEEDDRNVLSTFLGQNEIPEAKINTASEFDQDHQMSECEAKDIKSSMLSKDAESQAGAVDHTEHSRSP